MTNVVADSPTQLTFTLDKGYNPDWFTYNELSQITPMPLAWDITAKGAAPGTGRCSGAAYGSLDLACDAVYNFLSHQAGADPANPEATNQAVKTYGSNRLWQVVDGPWRLKSLNAAGTVTMTRNPTYSGPHSDTFSTSWNSRSPPAAPSRQPLPTVASTWVICLCPTSRRPPPTPTGRPRGRPTRPG